MQTKSLVTWPSILSEPSLTSFNKTMPRQRQGIVKLLPAPPPPDEKTIRELNALAAQPPFCHLHTVKKHDPL